MRAALPAGPVVPEAPVVPAAAVTPDGRTLLYTDALQGQIGFVDITDNDDASGETQLLRLGDVRRLFTP